MMNSGENSRWQLIDNDDNESMSFFTTNQAVRGKSGSRDVYREGISAHIFELSLFDHCFFLSPPVTLSALWLLGPWLTLTRRRDIVRTTTPVHPARTVHGVFAVLRAMRSSNECATESSVTTIGRAAARDHVTSTGARACRSWCCRGINSDVVNPRLRRQLHAFLKLVYNFRSTNVRWQWHLLTWYYEINLPEIGK